MELFLNKLPDNLPQDYSESFILIRRQGEKVPISSRILCLISFGAYDYQHMDLSHASACPYHYNPLQYIRHQSDLQQLARLCACYNRAGEADPFWKNLEESIYLLLFLKEMEESNPTFHHAIRRLYGIEGKEGLVGLFHKQENADPLYQAALKRIQAVSDTSVISAMISMVGMENGMISRMSTENDPHPFYATSTVDILSEDNLSLEKLVQGERQALIITLPEEKTVLDLIPDMIVLQLSLMMLDNERGKGEAVEDKKKENLYEDSRNYSECEAFDKEIER